jgi:hypothetical protein
MKRPVRRFDLVAIAIAIVLCAFARTGRADPPAPKAVFAVIVGSNVSVDTELPALKYADDDAARYLDLFRLLGARTYLLTRLDANTARLHAQAAAEALPPRRAELEKTLAQAATDVAQARARGVETLLYFIYAGHGSVRNGQGYITLEDARLTGADIASKVVGAIGADQFHIVVDACDSFLLAYPRGPGGVRRPVEGFQETRALADDERVGLLLSSSSSRESHEWEGFQAGVFSHEVRSGLYGAADADGDGQISYREIAAFVARANMAIPNERFRPQVHGRPPKGARALLDLRARTGRRIEIGGEHSGHYIVEDARGVRIAETNVAPGTTVQIVRGAPTGTEYVRRLDDDREFVIPADRPVVSLDELTAEDPRVASRGAAHEAFNLVFSLPFSNANVEAFEDPANAWFAPARPDADVPPLQKRWLSTRRMVGFGTLGIGAIGLGIGVTFSVRAANESAASTPLDSQRGAAARNDRIKANNLGAALSYVGGGAAVVTGLLLVLWPEAPRVSAGASAHGFEFGYEARF